MATLKWLQTNNYLSSACKYRYCLQMHFLEICLAHLCKIGEKFGGGVASASLQKQLEE